MLRAERGRNYRQGKDGECMGWNRKVRKLAVILSAIMTAGLLLANIGIGIYSDQVRKEYNCFLASVFGNVTTAYPEVQEEDLVRALKTQGNEDRGAEILAGYGVFQEYGSFSFAGQERLLLSLRALTNVFLIFVFFLTFLFFFRYLRRRHRNILELQHYMNKLNHAGYSLEIGENADDELSSLRNEIYKLAVMLQEQAQNALRQKRVLADSVTDISHQLKTPLTSVLVLIDNLSENPDMDRRTRQHFLSEITSQVTGMSWLTTTMMKLSRLDAGVVEMQESSFPLGIFVEEVLRRLEVAAELKDVSFRVAVPGDAMLSADRRWTGEALLNIVKNAVDYSSAGGCVEISGEENEVYTQIAVRDYGGGITKEEQEKLFRRFYNRNSAREDSMGIGLALAKEIVEKQDGYISVDSREGRGTRFLLRFLKH